MSKPLAPELLRKISEAEPLVIGWADWGWLCGREPVSPVLVQRWQSAGLLDDYGVSTLVLSNKGRAVAFGNKSATVTKPTQLEFTV